MNKKTSLVLGTVIALALAFFAASTLYKKSESQKVGDLAEELVRHHAPVVGPDQAPVTLVEFLDPECESCRAFYPLVKKLMQEFDGKVKLVIRYAPFHHNSAFAVKLLEAARKQGKYWEALEVFFKHQPRWGNHHHPKPELLWEILPEAGVDVEQVKKDMNDPAIETLLKQDIEDGQKLGVRRTPSFFVNGKPLQRFGYGPLRELIKSEL